VLIVPPSPWLISDREIPFYGVLYISAYLKKHSDCEVVICDLTSLAIENWYIPVGDIYGITGVSPHFTYIRDIAQKLKNREPEKPVICGGVHATTSYDSILSRTVVDACIIGEGERTTLKIVNGFDWKSIPGIVTREFNNGYPEIIRNISEIEKPDRKAIDFYSYMDSTLFNYLSINVKREASIITGRGCPNNCTFCCSKKMHKGAPRLESVESVVDEFLYLRDEFGVEMVNVLDDTFTFNKKRTYEVCNLLIKKKVGVQWFCLVRADESDYDMYKIMKEAGCLSVAPGFETGSNKVLRLMNKRANVEQFRACVKTAYKAGLKINGQLIVGFPGEEEEDVELTAEFIRNNPEVDTFGLHMFQPFPGCDVWINPEKYGTSIDKETDFSDYHAVGNHTGAYSKDPLLDSRFRYLKDIIGGKSRELRRKLMGKQEQ